jgi:hypothetical protein
MEKVKLELNMQLDEKIVVEYNGVKFEIDPFLAIDKQVFLINKYIEDYFKKDTLVETSPRSYLQAEFNLLNYIMQLNTNIDTDDLDNNLYVEDDFVYLLCYSIKNYESFRDRLSDVLDIILYQEKLDNSVGKVLSGLSNKLEEGLNSLKELNPDEIKKLQEAGSKMIEELQKSSLVDDVIKERAGKK